MKAERWPKYSSSIDVLWQGTVPIHPPHTDDDSEGREKIDFSYFVFLLVLSRLLPFQRMLWERSTVPLVDELKVIRISPIVLSKSDEGCLYNSSMS